MNRCLLRVILLSSLCTVSMVTASMVTAQPPSSGDSPSSGSTAVDWEKARSLLDKRRNGGVLTKAEKAHLDQARRIRQRVVRRRMADQRRAPATLVPLTDMTVEDRYEGQDGGLYGHGSNLPPQSLQVAAQAAIARIEPRNADGDPSPDGKIGFVSISMSNATMEFSFFKRLADASPRKSPRVVIVDCAQGGQAMAQWAPADARPWEVAQRRLKAAKVSPLQVQTAWVKLANVAPTGTLEEHGRKLEADTIRVLRNAKSRYPHLQIAYLGSRIWAGNATGGLNPEPYAYESAFVVRWLIQRQMRGDAELDLEQVPLLLWGPYLWAEGEKGRKFDDLVWKPADFVRDGVHPSQPGREKVAHMLLDFMSTDPLARPWFSAN